MNNAMTIKKRYFICLSAVFLSACNSIGQVSTNLDKKNFEQYFAASSVTIFDSEQNLSKERQYVGLVEGESCQVQHNDAPANDIDARTDARGKAAKLEANAIIFTACVDIEDKQCKSMKVCYGKAFKVNSIK